MSRNLTKAAIVPLAPAIVALALATISLWVYVEHSQLLIWIVVGLAILTFVYSVVRYTHVVGRRTVRIDVRTVWVRAPRAWRAFLIVCVVWGVAVIAIGDHVTLETPVVRNGHYVTTRYGHVVRYVSSSEYRDLKMGRLRLFCGIAGIVAAVGATIIGSRRLQIPDGSLDNR
jgi:hypothetical protein